MVVECSSALCTFSGKTCYYIINTQLAVVLVMQSYDTDYTSIEDNTKLHFELPVDLVPSDAIDFSILLNEFTNVLISIKILQCTTWCCFNIAKHGMK